MFRWWSGLRRWHKVVLALIGVIVVLSVIGGVTGSGGSSAETDEVVATVDPQAEEDKRKGFHCLSEWDANHDGFEDIVRRELKDPDSMDTIETRVSPVGPDGQHTIFMEFRSRNSFGGMVVSTAYGAYSQETCDATLLSIT